MDGDGAPDYSFRQRIEIVDGRGHAAAKAETAPQQCLGSFVDPRPRIEVLATTFASPIGRFA
jgi:hypothetical protein